MEAKIHRYPVLIKEVYLDSFGHVNNAVYLTLFEEARWDLIAKNGYTVEKIQQTGLGPVIMEINIRYLRELRLREEIIIESHLDSYNKKVAKMSQKMVRNGELCCQADITFGLFSLHERKLVAATPEWLAAIGCE